MSYEKTIEYESLLRAGEKCCNGGRWKSNTQMFEINILRHTSRNRKRLKTGNYKFRNTHNFWLCERGKWRRIRSHNIADRQVQKSYCKNELIPATKPRIMQNNTASQEGKGTEQAIKQFRADLAHAYKVCGGRRFFAVIYDFHDYFGSIPHAGAVDGIAPWLSDEESVGLLKSYAEVFPGEVGFGIGGEPSQVVAIVYPSSIDRMIACDPDVISSGRYMDDGYAIVPTLEAAHRIEGKFRDKAKSLRLTVNEKRLQIYSMETDVVTFLKKRTSMTETGKIIMRLVRKNVRDELRRIKFQKEQFDAGRMQMRPIEQSIEEWCAYARKYHAYKARVRVLDTYAKTFGIPWEKVRKYL